MKQFVTRAVISGALLAFRAVAAISVQEVGSGVAGVTSFQDYTNGPAVNTATNSAWVMPDGTSHWQAPFIDSTVIPNGTVIDYTYTFNIAGSPISGFFGFAVDDQAIGFVNGTKIFDDLAAGPAVNCADGSPTCRWLTGYNVVADLHQGVNTIQIDVRQSWGGPTGVDFDGHVVSETKDTIHASTPEPGFFGVLAGGFLIGLSCLKRRK